MRVMHSTADLAIEGKATHHEFKRPDLRLMRRCEIFDLVPNGFK